MPDIIKAALEGALKIAEYAVAVYKTVDNFGHEQLAKLEAVVADLRAQLGLPPTPEGGVFGAGPNGLSAQSTSAEVVACVKGE